MPGELLIPISLISFKVTQEGATQVLGSAYAGDEITSRTRDLLLDDLKPSALSYRIIKINHEGDKPHKSHLALRWDASWQPGDPNAPQIGLKAVEERSIRGINPLEL